MVTDINTSTDANRSTLLTPDEVTQAGGLLDKLITGMKSAILGQDQMIESVVICMLAQGHVLLEGLPGLGKTELVKSLSKLLGLRFQRIQFTPDLLPSDIVGAPILQDSATGRELVFHPGPVFANLVLADEINRATPKTQSAMLEAMQEHRVTVMGQSHTLPSPFFVLATQNPIELEGTYPLPEAQVDRFTFKIDVYGVDSETLRQIITTRQHGRAPDLAQALSADELNTLFEMVDQVHLPEAIANYISRMVASTSPGSETAPPEIKKFVRYGASPRAAIGLAGTCRAAALVAGKPNAGFEEVRRVAPHVLGHRMILDYSAKLEGWDTTKMVVRLLDAVPEIDRRLPPDLNSD